MSGKRPLTRRQLLRSGLHLGAASALAGSLPSLALVGCHDGRKRRASRPFLSVFERSTLDAAVSRIVPAEGPGDWSAADVGAGEYIDRLLALEIVPGDAPPLYAGGPFREDFPEFQRLPRAKALGWQREIKRLRVVYTEGLAALDERALGSFIALPDPARDAILLTFDLEGSEFFAALYAHTMEGVYAHPVYGGNRGYRAWQSFGYAGDVHGARFPDGRDADDSPWNVFGGYSPEEMSKPGGGE